MWAVPAWSRDGFFSQGWRPSGFTRHSLPCFLCENHMCSLCPPTARLGRVRNQKRTIRREWRCRRAQRCPALRYRSYTRTSGGGPVAGRHSARRRLHRQRSEARSPPQTTSTHHSTLQRCHLISPAPSTSTGNPQRGCTGGGAARDAASSAAGQVRVCSGRPLLHIVSCAALNRSPLTATPWSPPS